jgi:hypothetical protein
MALLTSFQGATLANSKAELTRQVKVALANPYKLAEALGLVNARSQKQARGIIVNCPAHDDTGRPNCSITVGKDGTARVKCHACQFHGDAITLVGVVHGLDLTKEFKRALRLAAELAGQNELADEIGDGVPRPDRIQLPEPRQITEAPWPDRVSEVWNEALPLHTDDAAINMLTGRGIDATRVELLNLARILPKRKPAELPAWARFADHKPWGKTGHRMLMRSFDAYGTLRSLRAWRLTDNETPKRLPPRGCRSAGLVLADRLGWHALKGYAPGQPFPSVLWIVEGEPDWLAASLAVPGGHGVLGIGSGGWTKETAEKCCAVSVVMIATHADDAGDRYAGEVLKTVPRATRWRPPKDLDECKTDLQALLGTAAKWCRMPHQLGD